MPIISKRSVFSVTVRSVCTKFFSPVQKCFHNLLSNNLTLLTTFRVERSGEFVVGVTSTSYVDDDEVADVVRDPYGLEPTPPVEGSSVGGGGVRTSFTQWLKRQRFIQRAVKKFKGSTANSASGTVII